MVKRGLFLVVVILLIALATLYYLFYIRQNQPATLDSELINIPSNLITLDNFDQVSEIFDNDSGYVRVIALLSPTWPASLRGFSGLQEIAAKIPDAQLHFYIIWMPIYPSDTWESAVKQSNLFRDERLTYFWDHNQISGITWQQVLAIDQLAWDLYFIYDRNQQWQFEPTPPDYWMRQLKGLVEAPLFDTEAFEEKVKEML